MTTTTTAAAETELTIARCRDRLRRWVLKYRIILIISPFVAFVILGIIRNLRAVSTTSSERQQAGVRVRSAHNSTLDAAEGNKFVCAPWIPQEKRKIVASLLDNWHFGVYWKRYQQGLGALGGEVYWSVSLEYVLRQLDFELVNALDFNAIRALRQGHAHRYIRHDLEVSKIAQWRYGPSIAEETDVTCRVRQFSWWNQWNLPPNNEGANFYFQNAPSKYSHDPRQILSVFEDDPSNSTPTCIPFFTHSQVTLPPPTSPRKEKQGFLFEKGCNLNIAIVHGLLEAGFKVYTQCSKSPQHRQRQILDPKIPPQYLDQMVHTGTQGHLVPRDYAQLLGNMSFVLGFGFPLDSPTPYEALANGAAYLNPVFNNATGTTQHRVLVKLGPPYVYNYNFVDGNDQETTHNILQAAEAAYQNRFVSLILPQQQLSNVIRQVCRNLIESNDICEDAAASVTGRDRGLWAELVDSVLALVINLVYYVVKCFLALKGGGLYE